MIIKMTGKVHCTLYMDVQVQLFLCTIMNEWLLRNSLFSPKLKEIPFLIDRNYQRKQKTNCICVTWNSLSNGASIHFAAKFCLFSTLICTADGSKLMRENKEKNWLINPIKYSQKHASSEMRRRWWWVSRYFLRFIWRKQLINLFSFQILQWCWKNMFTHYIHNECIPGRICANRVW